MESKEFGYWMFGFLIGVLIMLITIGIVNQITTTNHFDKECKNPIFMGSEGLTQNQDLDRAFEESKPLLSAKYRYYDKKDGTVLWECENVNIQ